MPEYIYIARNPTFPDIIKIGYTERNPMERIRDLSRPSGVPTPYEIVHACIVKNGRKVEKKIHFAFSDHRVSPEREFFKIDSEKVIAILSLIQNEDVTPRNNEYIQDIEERKSIDEDNIRRSNFSFNSVNIPIGSILTFTRDESIEVEVVGDKKIKYNGRKTSLSGAAKRILKRTSEVRGPDYWMFEGETLTERRNRLENEVVSEQVGKVGATDNDRRRPPFEFTKIGIPIGSTIVFSKDRRKRAKVISDRQIIFDRKKTSLSKAAQKLLKRTGGVRGPDYWMFEGETLTERRNRLENEVVSEQVGRKKSTKNDRRRPPLEITKIGIPISSTIVFSKDPRKRAKVINDRQILFEGQKTSLSKAAKKALKRSGEVRGPDYWMFEGETLTERRNRLEKNNKTSKY